MLYGYTVSEVFVIIPPSPGGVPGVPVDEGTRPPVDVDIDFVTTCSLQPSPRAPVDECVKVDTVS